MNRTDREQHVIELNQRELEDILENWMANNSSVEYEEFELMEPRTIRFVTQIVRSEWQRETTRARHGCTG